MAATSPPIVTDDDTSGPQELGDPPQVHAQVGDCTTDNEYADYMIK
jgi:hypothetical protein